MLYYATKKKNKLNAYKAVRENIYLNNNKITIDLSKNFISDDSLMFQLAEMNLTNHLQTQNFGKNVKLIVKWWEN